MTVLSSSEYATGLVDEKLKHVLEFGVFDGTSIGKMRRRLPPSYNVYGFDSFEGLPEDWRDSEGKLVGRGTKGRFSTNGKPPQIAGIEWFKGWFTDTVPEYLKIAKPIALLHIDCDLYSSTKSVLWPLNDFVVPNTIIVFDEWFYNHNPKYNDHEQKAFYEWVANFGRSYEFVQFKDLTDSGPGTKWKESERKIVKITK